MLRLSFLAWRNLGFNRLRSFLTAGAVVLGVAMFMAALTANRTLEQNLSRVAQEVVGKADLEIRAFAEPGLSRESLERLDQLPGIEETAPYVRKRTFYRTPQYRGFLELVGIQPITETKIHIYHLVSGVFLAEEANSTVLLMEDWAAARGLGLGDSIELVTHEGFQTFTVIGLLSQAGIGEDQFGRVALVSLQTAQDLFAMGDRASRVSVVLEEGTDPSSIESLLPQALIEDYLILRPPEIQREILSSLADLRALLLLFAAVSLFVAAFLIYNTLAMSVAERVRMLGLLRAVGTSGGQIIRLVLWEALLLGTLGSLVGVFLGAGLAYFLSQGVATFQEIVLRERIVVSFQDALVSMGAGVGLAVLAGFVPAWRASRVTPVEALRPYLAPRYAAWDPGQWVWGLALTLFGLALTYFASGNYPALGVLGIFLLCVGIVPLSQPLIAPLGQLAAFPLRRLFPREGDLGRRNLERTPGRTALTVGALAVAIATILSLGILTFSTWSVGQGWVRSLFVGPWVVVSPVPQPPPLAAEFSKISGVTQVLLLRHFPANWEGRAVTVVGMDLAATLEGGALELISGGQEEIRARLAQGDDRLVLIPRLLAEAHGLRVGEALNLKTLEGLQPFAIAGILANSFPTAGEEGAILMDRQAMVRDFGVDGFNLLNLSDDGRSSNMASLLADEAELLGMELTSVDQIAEIIRNTLTSLFALLGATLLAALLVGGLAIANTMMVNVSERRYEIGVLRAAGMTVEQIQAMVLVEGGIMGGIASVLGLGMSLLLAAAMIRFLESPDFSPAFTVPWELFLPTLLFPPLIAILAAIYPARTAASAPISKVLRLWE